MFTQAVVEPSQTSAGDDPFLTQAWQQESCIDHILACPDPRLFWFQRRQSRKQAEAAHVTWSNDITDPEFRKNLRMFRRLIGETIARYQRERAASYDTTRLPKASDLELRFREVQQRIQLPASVPLTLKVLLGCRFTLERLLVELGDAAYLCTRAAELYEEREGTVVTWRDLYGDQSLPPLWAPGPPAGEPAIEATRQMVAQLLAAKEAQDLPIRARRELKQRALYLVAFTFLAASALLGAAMMRGQLGPVLLPAIAGCTGAALGMLLKLRDELSRGSQIREFVPVALAQLIVGATAGLFVSLIANFPILPILNVAGPRGVAAFSFVAGFSEAAFVGLIGQIAKEMQPKTQT